jgi:hypothetical protein
VRALTRRWAARHCVTILAAVKQNSIKVQLSRRPTVNSGSQQIAWVMTQLVNNIGDSFSGSGTMESTVVVTMSSSGQSG